MNNRHDPYAGSQFQVEVDGVVIGGFAEVAGIDVYVVTEPLREGGVNTHVHHLPGTATYANVVLRRGLSAAEELWQWCRDAATGRPIRKRASVILLGNDGTELWRWNIRNALPVRWSGPLLTADASAVAMETLELAHDGIDRG